MKTIYEKDDVSHFRSYVRKSRFKLPHWEKVFSELANRISSNEQPPILVIKAQQIEKGNGESSFIDIIGSGKTDITYFAANYFREKGLSVLAFPDIGNEINAGNSFYHDIFVPELLRLTDTYLDKLFLKIRKSIQCTFSILMLFLLLIRTSAVLASILFAFLLGTGWIGFQYLIEKKPEPFYNIVTYSLPLVIVIGIVLWVFAVWERISQDPKRLREWNDYRGNWKEKILNIDRAKYISDKQLNYRLRKLKKVVVIVDDCDRIDSPSLQKTICLVHPELELNQEYSSENKKKLGNRDIGLMLLSNEQPFSVSDDINFRLFNEHGVKRYNWLYSNISAASFDDIRLLLWGFYNSPNGDEILDALCLQNPNVPISTGFLLQFLYELAQSLEVSGETFSNLTKEYVCQEYEKYAENYIDRAEKILLLLRNDPYENEALEMLKYILAFRSTTSDKTIVDLLLKSDGINNPSFAVNLLRNKGILNLSQDNHNNTIYEFTNGMFKNVLDLTWDKWKDESENYYTRVFNALHEFGSKRRKDPPELARFCKSSRLVVDVLWREADALWLYGGEADTNTALTFYGLENGALSKWWDLFQLDSQEARISDQTFIWNTQARNPAFRFKTGRSPRSLSFIPDLFLSTAYLYFLSENYKDAILILAELWPQVLNAVITLDGVSENVKNRIAEKNEYITLLLAEILYCGPLSEENWKEAIRICEGLQTNTKNIFVRNNAEKILWKIRYHNQYGLGNLISPLYLVRESEPDVIALSTEKTSTNNLLRDLEILDAILVHSGDYLEWIINSEKSAQILDKGIEYHEQKASELRNVIVSFPKYLGKFPAFLSEQSMELNNLISQAGYLKSCAICIQAKSKSYDLRNKASSSYRKSDIGQNILKRYEFNENLFKFWDKHLPINTNSNFKDLINLREKNNSIYSKYLYSKSDKEARPLLDEITTLTKNITSRLISTYISESINIYRLVGQTANLKNQKYFARICTYLQVESFIRGFNSLSIDGNLIEYISWLYEDLNIIEGREHLFTGGKRLEQATAHFCLNYINSNPLHKVREIDTCRTIISKIKNMLPKLVTAELVIRQLQSVGNVTEYYQPNDVIALAQEAHEILKDCTPDVIGKSELDDQKAMVRWWIAESAHRLANHDPDHCDEYYSLAQVHLNWIERQSDREIELLHWKPKVKQIRAQFLWKQNQLKKAIEQLEEALRAFEKNPKDELLELIQTLDALINFEIQFQKLNQEKNDPSNLEEKQQHLGVLLEYQGRNLRRAINLKKNNQIDSVTYLCAIRSAIPFARLLFGIARRVPELSEELAELWDFAVRGYISFGFSGQAAIILAEMKKMGSHHLLDFDLLVRQCVLNWDPRNERTDHRDVENAFWGLVGKSVSILDMEESKNESQYATIIETHRLLARPKPKYNEIIQILEAALASSSEESPRTEDIDLLRLLVECHLKAENFEGAKKYQGLLVRYQDILGCQTYLEVAKKFSDVPEIHDRYLSMAVALGGRVNNRYSMEAVQLLTSNFGKSPSFRNELIRTEGDNFSYQRLIELPTTDYDQSECYNLLHLFENELRRLIAYQFNQKGTSWWKKGIPSDVTETSRKRGEEKLKGFELLEYTDLGDLFKIILFSENWEEIFITIFRSREFLIARTDIIISTRNTIAHNRTLSETEISEFVVITKHILKIVQPFLPSSKDNIPLQDE